MKSLEEKQIILVCAWCKKPGHSSFDLSDPNVVISHTICEECEKLHFPKEKEKEDEREF